MKADLQRAKDEYGNGVEFHPIKFVKEPKHSQVLSLGIFTFLEDGIVTELWGGGCAFVQKGDKWAQKIGTKLNEYKEDLELTPIEKRALELYPINNVNIYTPNHLTDLNLKPRLAFVKGYEEGRDSVELFVEGIPIPQVRVTIGEYSITIDSNLLQQQFVNVDFGGRVMIQIEKQTEFQEGYVCGFTVSNAVDGHGNNCLNTFKDMDVELQFL